MKVYRPRKTAEKMASYKAAAARNTAQKKQAPTRVSPRRKKTSNGDITTKKSPSTRGHGSDKPGDNANEVLPPSKNGRVALLQDDPNAEQENGERYDMVDKIPETPVRPSSNRRCGYSKSGRPVGSNDSNCSVQVEKGFEFLEFVPETPPMTPPSTGHSRLKRVHPPRPKSSVSESENDSEKPSKKRKTFTTPPRETRYERGHGISTSRPHMHLHDNRPESERTRLIGRITDGGRSKHTPLPTLDRPDRGLDHAIDSAPAKRFAIEENDLEVLNVSSATLSRMLDLFGKKLLSEVTRMQQDQVAEVRKIADNVLSSVSSEMRHIEGVFSMITKGVGGLRSAKPGAKTSLTEWEQKLNALTPDTDIIFNKDVFGMLLCYNTPVQALKVFHKYAGTDVEKAILSAQTLLFSLQPGDKKYSYSGTVGGLHSEFKFTVVQNAFFNVLRDTFSMFRTSTQAGEVTKESSSNNSATSLGAPSNSERSAVTYEKIKRPSWLETKVTKDHINEARNFLERPNQSRKKKVRRTPIPYDIACHVALRVYRLLGNYLHVRRGAVRSTFFQNLGYLLVPWSQHLQHVNQNDVEMSWAIGESPPLSFNLDEVPYTEQSGFVTDHSAVTSVDAKNKSLLRQMFSDWPGMVLKVQHTVHVVNGNGVQRRHSGGEPATMRRMFNLIDVAVDVCVDYCGAGSRETFLRGHKYSLRCVVIFALLFKAFCVEFMNRTHKEPSSAAVSADSDCSLFPDPSDLEVNNFSLKELIPGPSTQKNLLECRCLRMTRSEFNVFNYAQEDDDRDRGEEGAGEVVIDMMDIQESEEIGIGVI